MHISLFTILVTVLFVAKFVVLFVVLFGVGRRNLRCRARRVYMLVLGMGGMWRPPLHRRLVKMVNVFNELTVTLAVSNRNL